MLDCWVNNAEKISNAAKVKNPGNSNRESIFSRELIEQAYLKHKIHTLWTKDQLKDYQLPSNPLWMWQEFRLVKDLQAIPLLEDLRVGGESDHQVALKDPLAADYEIVIPMQTLNQICQISNLILRHLSQPILIIFNLIQKAEIQRHPLRVNNGSQGLCHSKPKIYLRI